MKKGHWDLAMATRILNWYRSVWPLRREELGVLLADLQFPHLFCGIASKYFHDRAEDWTEAKLLGKLDHTIRSEREKARVLPGLYPR